MLTLYKVALALKSQQIKYLYFFTLEPQNTLSETDWQRLWQHAENGAGNNKQDPNGSEVTDVPRYEESEVRGAVVGSAMQDNNGTDILSGDGPQYDRPVGWNCLPSV